ncbi:radical SAM protein [Campylobacterota bacterium]|nr:radical SAM protein [Campylobacterota bacterium]
MSADNNALNNALSFEEVAAKYPNFPRLLLLKIDMHRRGVAYTDRALSVFDPSVHQGGGTHIFGTRDGKLTARPEALTLRDGTSVIATPTPFDQHPYVIDLIDNRLIAHDRGEPVDEVFFWDKPDYYDKRTASGAIMQNVVSARPQRLYVVPNRYCHFWTNDDGGGGCKFCDIVNNLKTQRSEIEMPTRIKIDDVSETIREALKEKGRFTAIALTSGSDYHGEKSFDKEVNFYIEILQAIGTHFDTDRFPAQLICTAMSKEQIKRIYDNTGVTSLTYNIEVFGEQIFNAVCPGKAKWVGYKEWKRRLIDAVDVFGASRVNTGIVAGVELAKPYGVRNEEEGLELVLGEAEDLAKNGVSTVNVVWQPRPESSLGATYTQTVGSLEYYVRLTTGLQELRLKYGLNIDFDDYRRCGNHADSDLARVFQ